MPRPGPRPYECMRRAWHSDRHQPMRGSLIREIFRVVSEIHSPATKKNKEWQEKVPIVVLKAEEIMYSKANSEAEYMNLKTLWDRTNDAINIIIRREESTESSDLLQPCIEAALILGCIPRRASRSQRHNNPRTYLSSTPQELVEVSVPPKITKNTAYNGSHPIPLSGNLIPHSKFTPFYSNKMTPSFQNSSKLRLQSFHGQAISSTVSFHEFPYSSNNFHSQSKCSGNTDIHPSPSLGRMYPLHYSTSPAPHCYPTSEPNTGFLQNVLNCSTSLDASNGTNELCPYSASTSKDRQNAKCDLSLRLGRLPVPSSNMENRWICEVEDVGSTVCCDEIGLCDPSVSTLGNNHFSCLSSKRGKGFCFFPTDDHPFKSASSNPDRKGHNVKRKAPIGASVEDLRSYLLMSPSSKLFW